MIWSEFTTEVLGFLHVDAERHGIESFREQSIRAGVIDIQSLLPAMRSGHTTSVQSADFTQDGIVAGTVAAPDGVVKEVWFVPNGAAVVAIEPSEINAQMVQVAPLPVALPTGTTLLFGDSVAVLRADASVGDGSILVNELKAGVAANTTAFLPTEDPDRPGSSNRVPYRRGLWEDRKAMVLGLDTALGQWALSPDQQTIILAPMPDADHHVEIVWDGLKRSFLPGDKTPFTCEVAEAVAEFVKGRITQHVDKEVQLAATHFQNYGTLRRRINSDLKEKENS